VMCVVLPNASMKFTCQEIDVKSHTKKGIFQRKKE